MSSKVEKVAIELGRFFLMCCVLLAALLIGVFIGRSKPTRVNLVKWESSLDLKVDDVDMALWGRLVSKAEVCELCNALKEWQNTPEGRSRPMILRGREFETGDTNYGYTMVVGEFTQFNDRRPPVQYQMIVYYIGHRSGAIKRIDPSTGKVETKLGNNEWVEVKDDDGTWLKRAREVFRRQSFQTLPAEEH